MNWRGKQFCFIFNPHWYNIHYVLSNESFYLYIHYTYHIKITPTRIVYLSCKIKWVLEYMMQVVHSPRPMGRYRWKIIENVLACRKTAVPTFTNKLSKLRIPSIDKTSRIDRFLRIQTFWFDEKNKNALFPSRWSGKCTVDESAVQLNICFVAELNYSWQEESTLLPNDYFTVIFFSVRQLLRNVLWRECYTKVKTPVYQWKANCTRYLWLLQE